MQVFILSFGHCLPFSLSEEEKYYSPWQRLKKLHWAHLHRNSRMKAVFFFFLSSGKITLKCSVMEKFKGRKSCRLKVYKRQIVIIPSYPSHYPHPLFVYCLFLLPFVSSFIPSFHKLLLCISYILDPKEMGVHPHLHMGLHVGNTEHCRIEKGEWGGSRAVVLNHGCN